MDKLLTKNIPYLKVLFPVSIILENPPQIDFPLSPIPFLSIVIRIPLDSEVDVVVLGAPIDIVGVELVEEELVEHVLASHQSLHLSVL